jgi:hypothetical protein
VKVGYRQASYKKKTRVALPSRVFFRLALFCFFLQRERTPTTARPLILYNRLEGARMIGLLAPDGAVLGGSNP